LSSDAQSLCWSLLTRSWVAILAGDLDTALRVGQDSVDTAGRLEDSIFTSLGSAVLGWAQLEAGKAAECVELIPAAAGGPELPLIPAQYQALFQEVLTRAWLALDRIDEAERAVGHAETVAEQLGLGLSTALARRARATAMLAAGQPAAAAELALDSAAAAEGIDARIEAARSRTLAGQALAAAGDRGRAADELQRAAAELDACGALGYHEVAGRELRRLGKRFRRRRPPVSPDRGGGGAVLTPREHEIAELVGQGMTNRQIAAQLFLSEKTVETHLHHAFQKVGVSSRTALARELQSMG
jgi:DNA-binding CsgD family transcriptional regulator